MNLSYWVWQCCEVPRRVPWVPGTITLLAGEIDEFFSPRGGQVGAPSGAWNDVQLWSSRRDRPARGRTAYQGQDLGLEGGSLSVKASVWDICSNGTSPKPRSHHVGSRCHLLWFRVGLSQPLSSQAHGGWRGHWATCSGTGPPWGRRGKRARGPCNLSAFQKQGFYAKQKKGRHRHLGGKRSEASDNVDLLIEPFQYSWQLCTATLKTNRGQSISDSSAHRASEFLEEESLLCGVSYNVHLAAPALTRRGERAASECTGPAPRLPSHGCRPTVAIPRMPSHWPLIGALGSTAWDLFVLVILLSYAREKWPCERGSVTHLGGTDPISCPSVTADWMVSLGLGGRAPQRTRKPERGAWRVGNNLARRDGPGECPTPTADSADPCPTHLWRVPGSEPGPMGPGALRVGGGAPATKSAESCFFNSKLLWPNSQPRLLQTCKFLSRETRFIFYWNIYRRTKFK